MSNNNEWFPPSCAFFDECFKKCSQHLIQVNVQASFPLILPKSLLWCPQKQTAQNSKGQLECVHSAFLSNADYSSILPVFISCPPKALKGAMDCLVNPLSQTFQTRFQLVHLIFCLASPTSFLIVQGIFQALVLLCLYAWCLLACSLFIFLFYFSGFMALLVSLLLHF